MHTHNGCNLHILASLVRLSCHLKSSCTTLNMLHPSLKPLCLTTASLVDSAALYPSLEPLCLATAHLRWFRLYFYSYLLGLHILHGCTFTPKGCTSFTVGALSYCRTHGNDFSMSCSAYSQILSSATCCTRVRSLPLHNFSWLYTE